jgi:hypothetical protein
MLDLDEALERFHLLHPEHGSGLANHGPMACEALGALGHPVLRMAFVDRYAPRLAPLSAGRAIPVAEQAAALGRPERIADWIDTLERELALEPWRAVLERRTREWCDGLFAAAGHGWLRTAHAVRALEAEENPIRLRELAHGLAYWAARYQRLPGVPGRRTPRHAASKALRSVTLAPENRRLGGLFTDAVVVLDTVSGFERDMDELPIRIPDVADVLHELCVTAAELYLAHPAQRIAYAHVITIQSALRLLAPHLDPDLARRLLVCSMRAAAALHAISADSARGWDFSISPEVEKLAQDPAEIRYRAACSLEEHAIKLAEAALREDAAGPHPCLRLAAADAALHLAPTARC